MISGVGKTSYEGRTVKNGHAGIGLINVQHALNKYNGIMEQSRSADCFCVSLLLPTDANADSNSHPN